MKAILLPFVLSFALAASLVAALTFLNDSKEVPVGYRALSPIYINPKNKNIFLRIAAGGALKKGDLPLIKKGFGEPVKLQGDEALATFQGQKIRADDLPSNLQRFGQQKYLQLLLEELWIEAEAKRWQINIPEEQILDLSKNFFAGNTAFGSRRLRAMLLASALYTASGNNIKLIQTRLKKWERETSCGRQYPQLCN